MDAVPVDAVKLKSEVSPCQENVESEANFSIANEDELYRTSSMATPSRRTSSVRVRHRSASSISATAKYNGAALTLESHCPQHCPFKVGEANINDGVTYHYVPPDGGWGWMVLLGTVIVNTLIPGLVKSFGVLYVEFINIFNATPSSVSWIPAITFALYNLLGPVASMISSKFSCRFATILGGLSATIGLALSYFATSIQFMYFSYGVLGGIGAGMSYTPGVLMVGQYFDKHRGLANGLCASGSALGSIILPPFLNYLLDEYGCRGTILILCGLMMNVCVGAALYQPVQHHLKKVPVVVECQDDVALSSKFGSQLVVQPAEIKQLMSRTNNNSFNSVSDYATAVNPSPAGSRRLMMMVMRRPVSNPRFPQIVSEGRIAILEEEEKFLPLANGDDKQMLNGNSYNPNSVTFTIGSTVPSAPIGLGMGSSTGLAPNFALHRSPSMISNISTSSLAYLSTIHLGSTPAAYQLNQIRRDSVSGSRTALAAMINSQGSIHFPQPNNRPICAYCDTLSTPISSNKCQKCILKPVEEIKQEPKKESVCKLMFDVSLLRNTIFLLITFSVVASGIAYTNLLIILPAYANGIGIDKSQYTLLLSVIAGTDLVGRISGAWLSDLASFPCKYIYMAGFGISGLALMFMPQNNSFIGLAVCCAVFGLASGIYIGLMAVLLVKYLGADKLASSFGLSLAINGVVMMAGPPVVGIVGEALGSYEPIIFMLGVINFSGGLILILEPIASRHEARRMEKMVHLESDDTAVTLV
ncbi:hypothetical protein CHUAL_008911 [Chamberlinius hualienensis]